MRTSGSQSWRFAHDFDQSLHVALYVRDALRLETDGGAGDPPPLVGNVPGRSQVVGPVAVEAASGQWPSWWCAVVELQASTRPQAMSEPADPGARLREMAERHRLVFDPPQWKSLANTPALRHGVQELWVEACRWFYPTRQPYLPPSCKDVFAWEQVSNGANRAATQHGVSPGAVDGCAQVLLVEGSWWQLVAPGAALCSVAAARDPRTIPIILGAIFDSHLAR